MADDTNNIQQQTEAIRKQRIETARLAAEIENLDAQRRADIDLSETQKRSLVDLTRQLKARREEIERETKALEDLKKANEKYNASVEETKGFLTEVTGINMTLLDSFKKNADGVRDFGQATKTVMTAMLKFTVSMDKQSVGLAQATGYATDLNDNMIALADANTGLYLSLEQSSQVIGGLSTQFSDFNGLSEEAQRSTAELSGRFLNMGMSAEVSAKALDALRRGLKFNQTTAEATLASFEDLSMQLGRSVGQVTQDFNDLAPALARFGVDGPRVFRDLAQQARSLGLTTRQAFDFTEMFDTFESSADVAGKLNAQLGLQLNSVELMAASSEDRLKILRAEFNMQGTNFKDMSRRQKQMIAEIMGTDVDAAARLFGDPMEMRKFQREQAKDQKRMESFIAITQRWQSSMQQFFINMEPLLSVFRDMMVGFGELVNKVMANDFARFGSMLIGFVVAIKSVVKVLGFLGKTFGMFFGVALTALQSIMDIYDVYKAITSGEGDGGGNMWPAIAKLLGGVLGGAIGMAVGGPLGMGIGYTLGSLAASKLVPQQMNDGQLPGGTLMSTPDGQQIQSRPDDAIFLGTGDIHRTLKQIADNTSMTREGQRLTVSAPIKLILEADKFKQSIIEDVLLILDPAK